MPQITFKNNSACQRYQVPFRKELVVASVMSRVSKRTGQCNFIVLDKLKILPKNRTGWGSLSKSGMGCGMEQSLYFSDNGINVQNWFFCSCFGGKVMSHPGLSRSLETLVMSYLLHSYSKHFKSLSLIMTWKEFRWPSTAFHCCTFLMMSVSQERIYLTIDCASLNLL